MTVNLTNQKERDRLHRAVAQDRRIIPTKAHKVAFVESSNPGKFYEVSKESCECSDWIFRGRKLGAPCKHMIAASLQGAI